MRTWNVKADDDQSWRVDAPDDVTEAEVNAFAAEHADSWKNGGHYAMAEAPGAVMPKVEAPSPAGVLSKKDADTAVKALDEQMKAIKDNLDQLTTRQYAGPVPAVLGGTGRDEGPVTGMAPTPDIAAVLARRQQLQQQLDDLTQQRKRLAIGDVGQTYGGAGGALLGAGVGVTLGAPLGPPGMAVGGLLGAILGGAGGVAAGTHLWDIPEAQETREISDADAAKLIQERVISSLIWDGAFVLILGPGGRVLGKILDGSRIGPALKAAVRESLSWDKIAKGKETQMANVVEKRAKQAPPEIATQVSDALGVPAPITGSEANRKLIEDIAAKSGGHVPTTGEVRGTVVGGEMLTRKIAPARFAENDKILAQTAETIRKNTLRDLDTAGALTGPDLGEAIERVVASADTTLKRETGPVFERAGQQNVLADMRATREYLDSVLFRDLESGNSLLQEGRAGLERLQKALTDEPYVSMRAAQDILSGLKTSLRRSAVNGVEPTPFSREVVGNVIKNTDTAYIRALGNVKDPTLVKDLLGARALYRETMTDLYSDAMSKVARKDPEDVGRALTGVGSVTEIRKLRDALARAEKNAPGQTIYRSGTTEVEELGARDLMVERAKIDAGMVKGFIEKHTQSLSSLETKLRDAEFRLTLKELLTGKGAADPALGRKVLSELDRTLGVLQLIKPEMAPQPGRLGSTMGVGSVGAGSAGAAATGGNLKLGIILALFTASVSHWIGRATALSMTTGNMGVFRTIQRAGALAKLAGTNTAAAEAFHHAVRELDDWDRANGGQGVLSATQGE